MGRLEVFVAFPVELGVPAGCKFQVGGKGRTGQQCHDSSRRQKSLPHVIYLPSHKRLKASSPIKALWLPIHLIVIKTESRGSLFGNVAAPYE
ncbi:hypothetical protein D3C72_1265620 [compost metagenome]